MRLVCNSFAQAVYSLSVRVTAHAGTTSEARIHSRARNATDCVDVTLDAASPSQRQFIHSFIPQPIMYRPRFVIDSQA